MKKRKIMLGSAVLLAVLLVVGGTMAWFTATSDSVTNSFTAGTLKIELVDTFEEALNVNPGDCYAKDVYVKNLGTKTAYVRIEKNIAFDKAGLNLDVVEYTLGEGWVEHTDGYFYFNRALAAKTDTTTDRTTSLFALNEDGETNICFNGPNMDNAYQGVKLDIVIKAEAIQTTNRAAVETDQWGIDPSTL